MSVTINRGGSGVGVGRRTYRPKLFLPFTRKGAEIERRAIEVKDALDLRAEDAIEKARSKSRRTP